MIHFGLTYQYFNVQFILPVSRLNVAQEDHCIPQQKTLILNFPKGDSPSSFRLKPEMLSFPLLIHRLSLKIAQEERRQIDRQTERNTCLSARLTLTTYEEVYFRRPLHLNVI